MTLLTKLYVCISNPMLVLGYRTPVAVATYAGRGTAGWSLLTIGSLLGVPGLPNAPAGATGVRVRQVPFPSGRLIRGRAGRVEREYV